MISARDALPTASPANPSSNRLPFARTLRRVDRDPSLIKARSVDMYSDPPSIAGSAAVVARSCLNKLNGKEALKMVNGVY